MKRLFYVFIVLFLCFSQQIAYGEEPVEIILNGTMINTNVSPILEKGRVLVPIRLISESLESTVDWDSLTKTIAIKKGENNIKIFIGESVAYKNGQPFEIDVPPRIVNGRAFLPLAITARMLGEVVNWRDDSKAVVLITKDFINKKTEELISTIDMVYKSEVPIKSSKLFYNEFYGDENTNGWRILFDQNEWFTDVGKEFWTYESWIPKNDNKKLLIRVVNRYKTSDEFIYSDTWINHKSSPVRDMVIFIDLSENKFEIKWVGFLTPEVNPGVIPFDQSVFEQTLQSDLPSGYEYRQYVNYEWKEVKKVFEWGWIKTYGQKPTFQYRQLIKLS